MLTDTTIDRIEAWACSLPLEKPINLGTYKVTAREYTVVKVSVAGGIYGAAVALTRRTPVDVTILDVLAPSLIGSDAFDLAGFHAILDRVTGGMEQSGIIGRARSLLDIAIHDLRAKALDLPLWRLLGGRKDSLEVLLVEGYSLLDEPKEKLVERMLARADEGYKRLKFEIGSYATPGDLVPVLKAFRKKNTEARLVLDGLWRWKNSGEALRYLRPIREFDIDWIEDPFPSDLTDCYREFRAAKLMPVGVGDDASNYNDIMALHEAGVDVLRLDAMTIGGVTKFGQIAAYARSRGAYVSPHFYPQIHQHCAFGWNFVDHIEMIPTDRPFERTHDLIEHDAFKRVRNGRLTPPSEAGAGFVLNEAAVKTWARRSGSVPK